MNVKQLKEAIKDLPDDMIVVSAGNKTNNHNDLKEIKLPTIVFACVNKRHKGYYDYLSHVSNPVKNIESEKVLFINYL